MQTHPLTKGNATASERVYRLLLAAYPADFRAEYGPPMRQAFRDRCREAKETGGFALAVLWLHTLFDLAVTAPAEHLDTCWQDARYSGRVLRQTPGFTLAAVGVLALGIGANSAIFSVINAVLLRPLGVAEPDRLVMLFERQGAGQSPVAPSNFLHWREQAQSFEDIAAFAGQSYNLTGGGEPEHLEGARVSPGLFALLRAEPALGRTFTDEEDRPGKDEVVVLSHGLWQRRFGAEPDVLGQSVTLSGRAYTVIGVMPADYNFPNRQTELWTPLALDEGGMSGMGGRVLNTVARLKPGVTVQEAHAEMGAIAARLAQENPRFNAGWTALATPLHEMVVRGIRPSLLLLLGAVGFILLIACANVVNLLLARAAARQKEIAIRIALGASRQRLVRQLLTESLLLALAGGGLGLLLAVWGTRALVALSPVSIPRAEEIGMDGRVLGFTLAVALLTGIAFGLFPALRASRPDLNESLKEGRRSSTAGFGRSRVRSMLVVVEVALSVVLLIGAGLMIRSFMRLYGVNPGFNPENVLTAQVALPEAKYRENDRVVSFYRRMLERLAALPGVEAVGTTHAVPLSGFSSGRVVIIEGRPAPEPGKLLPIQYQVISPNYFRAMQIPLRGGRDFSDQDTANSPGVAIINEAAARQYWPGEDPIGQRVKHNSRDADPWLTVIGIVGDVRHGDLSRAESPTVYWTYAQAPLLNSPTIEQRRRSFTVVLRTSGDAGGLPAALRREVAAVDGEIPVHNVTTMTRRLDGSLAYPRYLALLLVIFAAVALALAAVGLYGVIAYAVAQRKHEIGIRMALGATARQVVRMVVGQGMALALAGVGVGLVASFALTRLMQSFLYEVTATDPATYAGIALALVGVALLACYLPARRAARVDPMTALRFE